MIKVLIVDDEKHVRRTINKLIDWNAIQVESVFEAEDGAEAIALILKEQPQLVITDMIMPVKNGMELMEWMETYAPDCKKIVVSSYNDFELVRHAVKHGGTDYLLKPIIGKQLQEALQKAIDNWKAESDKRLEYNKLKYFYRDRMLSNLIMDTEEHCIEAERLIQDFPKLAQASRCRMALLQYEWMDRRNREKFDSSKSPLVSMLITISNDCLQRAGTGIAFCNLNSKYEIGILLWDDPERAGAMMEAIHHSIRNSLGMSFDIGMGDVVLFPTQLQKSYEQAKKSLRERNLLDFRTKIHVYSTNMGKRATALRFNEFAEVIKAALCSGRKEQLAGALQCWFDVLEQMDNLMLADLELWQNEFNMFIYHCIEDYLPDEQKDLQLSPECYYITSPPIDGEGCFALSEMRRAVAGRLSDLMENIILLRGRNRHFVQEIARYIQDNYYSNITLNDLYLQFHLNKEYISRKFKQNMNENVIDYVNRIRINKAKALLLDPHMKVHEVAGFVGYQDEKYFSRVFKKIVGQSPKDFRAGLK